MAKTAIIYFRGLTNKKYSATIVLYSPAPRTTPTTIVKVSVTTRAFPFTMESTIPTMFIYLSLPLPQFILNATESSLRLLSPCASLARVTVSAPGVITLAIGTAQGIIKGSPQGFRVPAEILAFTLCVVQTLRETRNRASICAAAATSQLLFPACEPQTR